MRGCYQAEAGQADHRIAAQPELLAEADQQKVHAGICHDVGRRDPLDLGRLGAKRTLQIARIDLHQCPAET